MGAIRSCDPSARDPPVYVCVFVGDGGEVCVCVRACVHACVCVRACVHACVRARRGLSECQGVVSLCVSFTLYD